VLIAYYGGIDAVDGPYHEAPGIALFIAALALLLMFDVLIGASIASARRMTSVLARSGGKCSAR